MNPLASQMYAALGSELEHTADNAWRLRFAKTVARLSNAPGPLIQLGWFAELKAKATDHRLSGLTEYAQLCEAWCETIYNRLPESCRW
jgi:GrpB-like predicted nucleotidyltransferase (UPF0157 family)